VHHASLLKVFFVWVMLQDLFGGLYYRVSKSLFCLSLNLVYLLYTFVLAWTKVKTEVKQINKDVA